MHGAAHTNTPILQLHAERAWPLIKWSAGVSVKERMAVVVKIATSSTWLVALTSPDCPEYTRSV